MAILLILDPGHGGSDVGAVFEKSQEKYYTLKIALKVRDYLLSTYQVEIMMTRTTDKTVCLEERTNFANAKNADYLCSIHVNSGGGTGWESYIYNGEEDPEMLLKQDIIHQTVMHAVKKYAIVDRGQRRANLHVLRESNMPAILIENLFIDTPEDVELLQSKAFITDLSTGIAEGIAKALSLPKKTLYKVIAGVFLDKAAAIDWQNQLDSKGIESIVLDGNTLGKKEYRVQAGAFLAKGSAERRLNKITQAGIKGAFIVNE